MREPMKLNADVFLHGKHLYISTHGFEFAHHVPRPFICWLVECGLATPLAGDRYEIPSAVCEIKRERICVHIESACRVVFVDLDVALKIGARQVKAEQVVAARRTEEAAAVIGAPVQTEIFA